MIEAGQNTRLFPGAVAACVLPVGLGFIYMGLVGLPERLTDLFIILPVFLCFVLGTPLSAWMACRGLRGIDDAAELSRWSTSFSAGLKWSSAVHFGAVSLYTLGFMVWAASETSAGSVDLPALILLFSVGINLILWCALTLPLTALCATIFWVVTKFPEDVSDANV